MTVSRAMLLYGTEEPVTPPRRLAAGPLSVELEGGNLRYARYGDVEVLRAISFLIRSPTWATYEPEIAELAIEETGEAFVVTYRASVREGAQALDYAARIAGAADGTLAFHCAMHARTEFATCRAGFVVLHPACVAGGTVGIEHADGSRSDGCFPRLIDPVQPMRELRALTHQAAPGLIVTCRMDGDTFEMEDQRNWTDASFKTYVRPLSRPWPYTLAAGSRGEQAVTLSVAGRLPVKPPDAAAPIRVGIGAAIGPMPDIALGCTPDEARAGIAHAPVLAAAGVAALVCRCDIGEGHGADELRAFQALAVACGAAIDLQVVVRSVPDYAAELRAAAAAIRDAGIAPRAVAVSPAADLKSVTPGQSWPDCPPMAAFHDAARAAFPGTTLGGGTFAYFTELNRKRPDPALLDFLTFSTSPLVHSADDRSVMESLEALPAIVASLRAIAGATPFVVGPSAIGLRDNPYGATPLANPRLLRQPMSGADPRQHALFNAAWTLGYIARFAAGGAARVAVSAPAGAFGILDGGHPSPVFPVIAGCAALRGATVHAAASSREQDLLALCAVRAGEAELWLANLTAGPLTVAIPHGFHDGKLERLDAESLAARAEGEAMLEVALQKGADTLTIDAYAVIRARGPYRAVGSNPVSQGDRA